MIHGIDLTESRFCWSNDFSNKSFSKERNRHVLLERSRCYYWFVLDISEKFI